ncbi:MAG: peptide deformylase [Pseudomonadota bacterium]|nr:peptide deformylase [Pseudomonadota bacterium]
MLDPADFGIVELGDPRLRQPARPVAAADLGQVLEYARVLQWWMDQRGGVGIAAPQIGVSLQILIIASRPNPRYPDAPLMSPTLLINPEPLAYGGHQVALWEGCLSVPGMRGRVTRPDSVALRYLDTAGAPQELTLEGFPARIFLHEYDHLQGLTFVDRVQSVRDLVTEKVYREQIADD